MVQLLIRGSRFSSWRLLTASSRCPRDHLEDTLSEFPSRTVLARLGPLATGSQDALAVELAFTNPPLDRRSAVLVH
jgi:hypothetical protein